MSGRASRKKRKEEGLKTPKKRASRSSTLPPAPTDRTLDFAACRPELAGMTPGEQVLAVESTHAWQQVMVPVIEAVEARRRAPLPGERKRRGIPSQYTAYDFERLELLRRVLGLKSTQATRDWLAGDRARSTRELFALNRPRPRFGGKVQKLMPGIPCDGTMSDYRKTYFDTPERAQAYRALERWLLIEKLQASPWALEELDVLYADGSKLETHYTPPKKRGGEVVNAEPRPDRNGVMRCPITAPDAGFLPNKGHNADHAGSGWNIVFITTAKGTALVRRCVPLNQPEPATLTEMVDELGEVLSAFERRLRVLSADGGFNSQALRRKLHDLGIVENIHLASHSTDDKPTDGKKRSHARERTVKNVRARNEKKWRFEGSPTWFANGHRQMFCKCGKGTTVRRLKVDEEGRAVVGTQGACEHGCGTLYVQAGHWRVSTDGTTFRRIRPGEQDKAAWTIGNPLTFSDKVAASFGIPRYNAQEGLFGSQFTQRFQLLKGKRWFRTQAQVELETSMVICITHALSIEYYRRIGAPASADNDGAAPLALAA